MRILVVGDNAFERRLVMDLLIALGVKEIFIAEDGLAAFAQLTLKRPDMVIADAEMAPVSGFMLVREIRSSLHEGRAVPIVLFTSETSSDFADIARAGGANEVIAKPVSAQALRACLDDVVARPRDFSLPPAPQRRAMIPAAKTAGAAMDRAARALIFAAVDEARGYATAWASTGDPALLEAVRAATQRALDTSRAAGADEALTTALVGALRLNAAAQAGHADIRLLEASLRAARAVLAAPTMRNAMRHALAEAVAEAAAAREAAER